MVSPVRRFMRPFTRTAVMAFAWNHRRSILRWGRTLYLELASPRTISPRRLATIGKVLWAVTSDERIATSSKLRQVRLEGDTVVLDVAPNWDRTNELVERLLAVKGVNQVETDRAPR
jgi:hypothetical protein